MMKRFTLEDQEATLDEVEIIHTCTLYNMLYNYSNDNVCSLEFC